MKPHLESGSTDCAPELHIIYTESAILLSRRDDRFWHEIQDVHQGFKSSLGPWPVEVVIEYLDEEHECLAPPAREQIRTFLASGAETHTMTFERARR